ncbi:MAG: anion permease, partial [Dissulfurispiraceae bacterium]
MEEFCKDELSCILADELFSKARHVSLARLLPHITKTSFEPGHRIYEAGQPAQYLYIVLEGSVQLVSRGGKHIVIGSKKRFGEEGGTDFENYMSDAIAASRLTVLMVPKEKLSILLAESYGLKTYFYRSLVNTFSGEELSSPIPKTANIKPKKTEALEIIGWSCIIILSPLALYLGYRAGLNINAYVFLGIITATVIMWSFRLVDEYVPGIFALLASLCIGIAPPHVILSGFTSDGFFMALSILGLGTVIVSSGLSYRALLFMLRLFPKTQFGLNAGLILIGTFLTPILPTANGRIALLSPLLNDMTETTHLKLKGKAATQLAISTFTGTTLFSGMFLTSKSVNLAVFSMFPQQIQDQFQWLSWLFAATATGAVMFILFFIASAFFYRNQEPTRISGEQINQQLALLGKLKLREWAALSGIVIFILGIITYSLHKIQPPWLG